MSAEESKADSTTKSLADRMTFPTKTDEAPKKEENGASDLDKSQVDGAVPQIGGSALREPEFDVEVKLSDMQADPNNPLYSAKSFEELGL